MALAFDDEFPRARLAVLLEHFAELNDDREAWRVAYPIQEVVLLVICATIQSCDDFDDIVAWGERSYGASATSTTAFRARVGCAI